MAFVNTKTYRVNLVVETRDGIRASRSRNIVARNRAEARSRVIAGTVNPTTKVITAEVAA